MVMLFGSTLWGLYWLPLRWLDEAGLGGLWAIALIYLGATAGFAWHACFLTAPIALGLALAGGATLAAPAWTLLASLALGLVWMTAMTAATQHGVSRLPLQRSSVLLLFELVVGVVSAALLAGEGLSGRELMGGGCIVLAGLAVVWQTKPRSA